MYDYDSMEKQSKLMFFLHRKTWKATVRLKGMKQGSLIAKQSLERNNEIALHFKLVQNRLLKLTCLTPVTGLISL